MTRSMTDDVRSRPCSVTELCIGAGVVLLGLVLSLVVPWAGLVVLVGGLGLWVASMTISSRERLPEAPDAATSDLQSHESQVLVPQPAVAAFSAPPDGSSVARRGGIGRAGRSAHRTGRLTHHRHASV
jgi:hypothetical protein